MPERIAQLKPRPRDRVTVTLSGGRFFTIPAERAASLSEGVELSDDEVARLERVDQYFRGMDKAVRLLSLRARTRYELKTALNRLEIAPPVRDGIVAELEEQGLVDDRRFALEYVRVKADVRAMGPHRLRHDLRKRGVAGETIEAVLGEEFDVERQESMARALVERKVTGPVDEKTVRRVAGLLRRKGYDYEVVNRISYDLLQRIGSDNGIE
jgi:regulatory protein